MGFFKTPFLSHNDRPMIEETPRNDVEIVEKTEGKVTEEVKNESDTNSEIIDESLPHGVQAARAMTHVWTTKSLVMAYILIWIVHFMQAWSSTIVSTLTPYVTSAFSEHSLTATTSIIANILGGLFKLPYAKLLDVWGRPQGFALMITSLTLGLVMMAGCNDVKTYCAAQVFYTIGYNGISFTSSIFIADTSQLKNRAFWFGYASSPWLITIWCAGPAAQSILDSIGFRWGFGIWAIIFPLVCGPLAYLFYHFQNEAVKRGLLKKKAASGRTFSQSLRYYAIEFDVIGLFLLCSGLSLFLLSFSLYSYQANEWRSPLVICFLIFGGLLIIAFSLYEGFLAPKTFMPWYLIKNRTVFFTYTMVASIYCTWYIWHSYFYSMLIVVYDQSVTNATYITNIYTMGSCFWAVIVGIIIRYNGRIKWLAVYFGAPLTTLAGGLLIHFRQPGVNIGYIVMCQIFTAIGGGTLVICEQMTIMAVSEHKDIPAVLAMESTVSSIGDSIGLTVASALWTGIFPQKLKEYLPADAQGDLQSIYGSVTVQSSYPVGSDTRNAINHAYGDTQKIMLIASTCLHLITMVSPMLWKDVNVKDIKQVSGRVF